MPMTHKRIIRKIRTDINITHLSKDLFCMVWIQEFESVPFVVWLSLSLCIESDIESNISSKGFEKRLPPPRKKSPFKKRIDQDIHEKQIKTTI